MIEKEDKLIQWMEMDPEERRKYNGYEGFLRGELFKDNNLFMMEDKRRLKRRLEKERSLRERQKLNKQKEKNG